MSLRHGLNGVVDPALTSSFSSIMMGRGWKSRSKMAPGKVFSSSLELGGGQ